MINYDLLEEAIKSAANDTQDDQVPIHSTDVQTVWALIGPSKLLFEEENGDKALQLAAEKPNRVIFSMLLSQDGRKFIFSEQAKNVGRHMLFA